MTEVLFSLGSKMERILITNQDTEAIIGEKLAQVFGISYPSDIIGVRNIETGRIYSLQEIISDPSVFDGNTGSIVIGRTCVNGFLDR